MGRAVNRWSGRSPGPPLRETIATLKTNKPLAFLCGSSFFYMIGLFAVTGATAFYAQYVLNNIALVALITLVNSGISLLITPFIPLIIRKVGKKNVYQYCGLLPSSGGSGCSSPRRTCCGWFCSLWRSRASAPA